MDYEEQCALWARKISNVLTQYQYNTHERISRAMLEGLQEIQEQLDGLYGVKKQHNADVLGHFACAYAYVFKRGAQAIRYLGKDDGANARVVMILQSDLADQGEVVKGTVGVCKGWWESGRYDLLKNVTDRHWLCQLDQRIKQCLDEGAKVDTLMFPSVLKEDGRSGGMHQKHLLMHLADNDAWIRHLKALGVQGQVADGVHTNALQISARMNHPEQVLGLLKHMPQLCEQPSVGGQYAWQWALLSWNLGMYEKVLEKTPLEVMEQQMKDGSFEEAAKKSTPEERIRAIWANVLSQKQQERLEQNTLTVQSVGKRKSVGL